MTLRRAVSELLPLDDEAFATRVATVVDEYDHPTPDGAEITPGERSVEVDRIAFPVRPPRTSLEMELVRRLRLLDSIPLGLTLSGPAYEDNPIIYANRTFRELTTYTLSELNGRNPRLLQGPETEADAVADLREALSTWDAVTVTLTNYRADGTRFRNRLSLCPLADETGTVANWVGIQAVV